MVFYPRSFLGLLLAGFTLVILPLVGAIRIGRGATIGPNAVVTQDVPSHDTIVVEKRREDRRTVVNV